MNSSAFTFDVPFSGGGGSSFAYQGTGYANPHAPTSYFDGTATTTYEYDENGNLLSETRGASTTSYTWDYANRLVARGDGTATTTFGYDYSGQRVSMTVGSTTTITPNKYYTLVSTVVGSTTYATSTSSIWSGDTLLAYIDQPIIDGVATGTAATYYVHPDNLGSVSAISDQSGNLVNSRDYFPYGAVRVNSGDASLKRGYINQFTDADGLNYFQARYEDPQRGQFISEDPTHLAIGNPALVKQLTGVDMQKYLSDPQMLNSYSYARGNPITSKDPSGNASYIYDNGAGMSGTDVWNHNTYYEYQDRAMVNSNAAFGEANRGNVALFAQVMWPGSGTMDYSLAGAGNPDKRGFYFFNGKLVKAEEFGNLNYGYTGTAFGFGPDILYAGAGDTQVFTSLMGRNRGPSLNNPQGYFDDPRDTTNIRTGINTYNSSPNRSTVSQVSAGVSNAGYNASVAGLAQSLTALAAALTSLISKLH